MVHYCTSLPNSLFNNITLVAWTQPWWVGILTPENLVNTTNRSFTYRSFPHQTSCQTFTSNRCFAPQWAQDQDHHRLGVLLSSFTGMGKGLPSSPKLCFCLPKATLPRQLLTLTSICCVTTPTPRDTCAFPHTHTHSQSTHSAWCEFSELQYNSGESESLLACGWGGVEFWTKKGEKKKQMECSGCKVTGLSISYHWFHKLTSKTGDEWFSVFHCRLFFFFLANTNWKSWVKG